MGLIQLAPVVEVPPLEHLAIKLLMVLPGQLFHLAAVALLVPGYKPNHFGLPPSGIWSSRSGYLGHWLLGWLLLLVEVWRRWLLWLLWSGDMMLRVVVIALVADLVRLVVEPGATQLYFWNAMAGHLHWLVTWGNHGMHSIVVSILASMAATTAALDKLPKT